jgi:uncharacterized protein (DUF2235 family)
MSLHSFVYKRTFSRWVGIEFIGVWDTVSAVGALYPRILPFSADNRITKTFRHALSLDERRAKFRSNTWQLVADPSENPINPFEVGLLTSLGNLFLNPFAVLRNPITVSETTRMDRWRLDLLYTEKGKSDWGPTDVKEVWFPGSHSGPCPLRCVMSVNTVSLTILNPPH